MYQLQIVIVKQLISNIWRFAQEMIKMFRFTLDFINKNDYWQIVGSSDKVDFMTTLYKEHYIDVSLLC